MLLPWREGETAVGVLVEGEREGVPGWGQLAER